MKRRWLTPVGVLLLLLVGSMLGQKGESLKERATGQVRLSSRPGEFLVTVCLGPFRPFLVNLLWLEVEQKHRQRRFFEELALLRALTELQPKNGAVWELASYSLAYDVAFIFPKQEDQWRWVREGLLLLREGIERNPEKWTLKKQMAFFLWHRLRQSPQGKWLRWSRETTYLERQFERDFQLNPKGLSATEARFLWARRTLEQELDVATFVIFSESALSLVRGGAAKKSTFFRKYGESLEKIVLQFASENTQAFYFLRRRWMRIFRHYARWLGERGREKKRERVLSFLRRWSQ